MNDQPYTPGLPPRNGHAHAGGNELTGARRCPDCGVTGVRYLRSTGRWLRDATGQTTFAYVTFCAACGHEYPQGNV
jgi:hypothetical protein